MQFKIISVLALAMMAAALPTENIAKRTDSQDAANQCSQSQTLQCCNSLQSSVLSVLPIGIGCVTVNLLAALTSQCAASQKLACCTTGDQTGGINVALPICAPIL